MKLRENAKDHNLVEDDFGNPIFRFLGLHPRDKDDIISKVNNGATENVKELWSEINYLRDEVHDLEKEAEDLTRELKDAEAKLDSIQNIL